jgi:hypothetical protein
MKRSNILIVLMMLVLFAAACSPQTLPQTGAGAPQSPAAVEAARQDLAARLGLAPEDVNVIGYEEVDWPDGCLGLGGPAEACLAAITRGYAVTLEAGGEEYAYRTNLDGNALRPDTQQAGSAPVDLVREMLADRLGLDLSEVDVLRAVPVDWPDACLGLPEDDEMCAMMITPGFEIVLAFEGEEYTFRTNEDGSLVREVRAEPAEAARQFLMEQLALRDGDVELVSQEAVDWPDACLGVSQPDVMCAQMITPGYRFVFNAGGAAFTVHTNADASAIVLAADSAN